MLLKEDKGQSWGSRGCWIAFEGSFLTYPTSGTVIRISKILHERKKKPEMAMAYGQVAQGAAFEGERWW